MTKPEEKRKITLAELAQRTGIPRRTVRYYIQRGLLPPPHGAKRGAWYDEEHESRLNQILHLKSGGLNLEAIARILDRGERDVRMPLYSVQRLESPMFEAFRMPLNDNPEPEPTTVTATHIRLDKGLELVVDSARAKLTDDGVARLNEAIVKAYRKIKKEESR